MATGTVKHVVHRLREHGFNTQMRTVSNTEPGNYRPASRRYLYAVHPFDVGMNVLVGVSPQPYVAYTVWHDLVLSRFVGMGRGYNAVLRGVSQLQFFVQTSEGQYTLNLLYEPTTRLWKFTTRKLKTTNASGPPLGPHYKKGPWRDLPTKYVELLKKTADTRNWPADSHMLWDMMVDDGFDLMGG